MQTIDSYVVDSRIDKVSSRRRRRALWLAIAACLAVAVGLTLTSRASAPWRAKYEARVAADPAPYPGNEDDERIAAFQQSVAISHLTALAAPASEAPGPLLEAPRPLSEAPRPLSEAPRPASVVAKPARPGKLASSLAKKGPPAPAPPPRPAAPAAFVAEKVAVPAAPPAPRTPVLIDILGRIEHAPAKVVDFAYGVTERVLALRPKGGL